MSQEYPPSYQTGPTTNSTAVISLILSILGAIGILPLIGSIAGIVTGSMAKNEIARSGGMQTGEGLAQAGVIIGWVGIVLAVLGICVALLIVAAAFGLGFFAIMAESTRSLLPLALPFV